MYVETYQLNGMKFTVEGMKDGVGKLGDSIHDVKLSQSRQEGSLARTENLLNSLYLMCCDSEYSQSLYTQTGG